MTEVDRLRAAADELSSWASTEGDWSEPEGGDARHWALEAALLRAVADTHAHYRDCCCREHVTALALADTILGSAHG